MPSLRACRARPSGGWAIRAGMALRGKPWDNGEGGFLGGARSPRPGVGAERKLRHNIIIRGKRTPGGPRGQCFGEGIAIFTGVRSPPLRGDAHPTERALRGTPRGSRGEDFSEGCALRVRVVRPHECRGLTFRIHALTIARWPTGNMPGWSDGAIAGVRSPPLRGVGKPWSDGLTGRTRRSREGRFSRRGAVSASAGYGRTNAVAFHSQYML